MQSVDVWLTTLPSRSVVEEGLNRPCLQSTTTPHPDWNPFDAQRESAVGPAIPEIKSLVRRSTNFWDLGKEGDEREGGFPSHVTKYRQQRLPFPPIATMQAQRPQKILASQRNRELARLIQGLTAKGLQLAIAAVPHQSPVCFYASGQGWRRDTTILPWSRLETA